MIKRTLLYEAKKPGQFFDEAAYELHLRKALAFMGNYGCRRLELSTVLPDAPTPGARADRPDFYRILEAYFDDMESAYSCFSSPEMQTIQKVANYHDLGMLGFFAEIDQYDFDETGRLTAVRGPRQDRFKDLL